MKFTRDERTAHSIRHVEPGAIRIGEEIIRENVVLTPDQILRGLPLYDFDSLSLPDLEQLLEPPPEMLILGTGWRNVLPPRELTFALGRRGIAMECMGTPAACRTFNILISEGRRPTAILTVLED